MHVDYLAVETELVAQNLALGSLIQILLHDSQHLQWVWDMAGMHNQEQQCVADAPWYEKQVEVVVGGKVRVLGKEVPYLDCAWSLSLDVVMVNACAKH